MRVRYVKVTIANFGIRGNYDNGEQVLDFVKVVMLNVVRFGYCLEVVQICTSIQQIMSAFYVVFLS